MLTALQRTDSGRVSSIRIGIGRGKNTASEGGVVTATVLSVQRHHDVEHACFFRSELSVGTQHGKDGFGSGLSRNEAMHDHRLVVELRAHRVVREHHDARQARDQRDRRINLVDDVAILRVLVIGVEQQHRARQRVHDVVGRRAHDGRGGEAVGQLTLRVEHRDEAVQLVFGRQIAHQQQIGDLLVVETAAGVVDAQQVADLVTAQTQRAFVRQLLVVGDDVAVDVGDAGDAGDDLPQI